MRLKLFILVSDIVFSLTHWRVNFFTRTARLNLDPDRGEKSDEGDWVDKVDGFEGVDKVDRFDVVEGVDSWARKWVVLIC